MSLFDVLMAPMSWLERARGWRRLVLIAVYAVVFAVATAFLYRESQIWGIPDPGEPFDLSLGHVKVADSDNAMLLYRQAANLLRQADPAKYAASPSEYNAAVWAQIPPVVRTWVEDNRPALELWLAGVDRPDALAVQPEDRGDPAQLALSHDLQVLATVGLLEAARLEDVGDLDGAWRCYRGALRTSRHLGMHGGGMERWGGNAILGKVKPRIEAWAELPGQTGSRLKMAVGDLLICQSMTPPLSTMVQADYFETRLFLNRVENWQMQRMDRPGSEADWTNHVPLVPALRHFLRGEPRRSLRIHRLLTAGLLAQIDKERTSRPPLASKQLPIFTIDVDTPTALQSLSPERLEELALSGPAFLNSNGFPFVMVRLDFEQSLFEGLRVRLAEKAYALEKGHPPKLYGDLVPAYLESLPEGFSEKDPTGLGTP